MAKEFWYHLEHECLDIDQGWQRPTPESEFEKPTHCVQRGTCRKLPTHCSPGLAIAEGPLP